MKKRNVWIFVNILFLLVLFLLGLCVPQGQGMMAVILQVYVVLLCAGMLLSFLRKKTTAKWIKPVTVVWAALGLLLIVLFLLQQFDNIPILLLYSLASIVLAVVLYWLMAKET